MHSITTKRIIKLLIPSFSSGFLCLFFGLFIAGFVFVSTAYLGSYESLQLNDINMGNYSDNGIVGAYQNVYFRVTDTDGLGASALFVFWSLVGAVSYVTVVGFVKGLRGINAIKDETSFVHMDKRSLVRQEITKLTIRLGGLAIFFVCLHYTATTVIPAGRDLARIGATEATVVEKIKDCLSAVVVVATALHVNVVLIRLIALRVRLFGEQLPEEVS